MVETVRVARSVAALSACAAMGGFLAMAPAQAYDGIVEKQEFVTADYVTQGGETIAEVRVGWEAYGELNEARDNVILVTHFFSGNSHAAGRYTEDGPAGYWDYMIGSGLPIDTDEYYVVSVDSLVNLNPKNPNVITTGPASINPETGEPYGMDFPIVTIRDFVDVQKLLMDELGVDSLHAVIGASMGSLQAIEWASAYPDMVERVIPVIGGPAADAWLIAWLNAWAAPIMLDPNWNGGDYYGGPEPVDGLAEALKLVTLQAWHWDWFNATFGRSWADEGADPAASFNNQFAVEAWLEARVADRAATADANHFLYLVKANQVFLAGHGGSLEAGLEAIEAKTLIIPAVDDLVFPPLTNGQMMFDEMARLGERVEFEMIPDNDFGHLDGVVSMGPLGDRIAAFLASD